MTRGCDKLIPQHSYIEQGKTEDGWTKWVCTVCGKQTQSYAIQYAEPLDRLAKV